MSILNTITGASVLVMLDSDVCSPCYTFESNGKSKAGLSPEDLRDVLSWAAEAQPQAPELLFLIGADEPPNAFVASTLDDMSEQVVMPLLSIDRQKRLGIPFSRNQTVVADSLRQIIDQAFPFALITFAPQWGLRGIILAGFLAAIMSTVSALTNAASTIFSLDI